MANLVTLPNLYCSPNDVYDFLGSEGAQLRLDDHNLASGQIVTVTGTGAAVGAASIPITALQFPLIAGTDLIFDGGNMPQVNEVVLSATGKVGDTTLTVNPLTLAMNAGAAARDSGVNAALAQRLVKACQYATSRVKLYCTPRYDDSQLATTWSCNRWATTLAAQWLCRRRAQPVPKGIAADAEEVMDELKGVRFGVLNIEDIGTRTSGWPFISNATVDPAYDYMKTRVEPNLSEGTPTQYAQTIDWNSALFVEWW
jgi:hypothetical protein